MIPYGRQDINREDIKAVNAVLRSDYLTQGETVPRFEEAVARHCAAEHAIASNSATSSLHLACLALGVGPGDLVWTSPITFVASANAARYCGAEVDFVDIDEATFNMDPSKLAEKLERAKRSGKLPKVIIPVHMAGFSCDMKTIGALAKFHGVRVLEDASHCIGASYNNKPVGACEYSDICVFSFHPVKIITTAEGGMATTNDPELAAKMRLLRSHGITRDQSLMRHAPDGPWYYQQLDLGFNYRMTEMQGALGLSQMNRLTQFIDKRNRLAVRYEKKLKKMPIRLPARRADTISSFHLYIIHPDLDAFGLNHKNMFVAMHENGVGVNLHYIPVHLQPYYRDLGFKPGDFPVAERYYQSAMSIPLYHAMTYAQQDKICNVLQEILNSKKA